MLHGRGGSADDMLRLSAEIAADDVAYLAPEAPRHTWYPFSFLVPLEKNEPSLSASLGIIHDLVDDLQRRGVEPSRVALIGFSQGGCLSLEYAARHARRYAAIIGLSAGLIGPPGTPREYAGSLDGTPVFLGCSDIDPHIPLERVQESAAVFRRLGADVDERIYARMGHTVNRDELDAVRLLLGVKGRIDPAKAG